MTQEQYKHLSSARNVASAWRNRFVNFRAFCQTTLAYETPSPEMAAWVASQLSRGECGDVVEASNFLKNINQNRGNLNFSLPLTTSCDIL